MSSARRAFTLIEMLACLLIMALAVGLVMASLRGRSTAASLGLAIQNLIHEDQLARQQAQRLGEAVQLQFDLDSGSRVWIQHLGRGRRGATALLQLPEGCRIERLWLGQQWLDRGQVSIPCSIQGGTPSYALLVSAPKQPRQGILVAGLSGEVQRVANEQQVEDIFQVLAGGDAR